MAISSSFFWAAVAGGGGLGGGVLRGRRAEDRGMVDGRGKGRLETIGAKAV